MLKIANQSKINLQFDGAFVQLSFVDSRNFYPNRHGDLNVTDTRSFYSRRQKVVNAAETDFAYYEMVAPCETSLVRVLVKLPSTEEIKGEKLVYERKVLVPIGELCSGKLSEVHAGSEF